MRYSTTPILLLCMSVFLFPSRTAFGQPAIQWQRAYGGTNEDYANCIIQTFDGGYIFAGGTKSADGDASGLHGSSTSPDVWVVKTNASGAIQWQKSLGGTNLDYANFIQQTADSGYIIAGRTESTDGDLMGAGLGTPGFPDFWVVRLNDMGGIKWQRAIGNTSVDMANCVRQTADGGFIVAGQTYSDADGHLGFYDYRVAKFDSIGNLSWQKVYGGHDCENATSVLQTADGGYLVAGTSGSSDGDITTAHGGYDYWLLKLDDTGAIQWQKSLGGDGSDGACFDGSTASINHTADGGYILAGTTQSTNGDVTGLHGLQLDCWVVKLTSTATVQWQRCLGSRDMEGAASVAQTVDGGYIVGAYAVRNGDDVSGVHGSFDFWVFKLSGTGALSWQKCLGGTESDRLCSVQQTKDNGFILAGQSLSSDGDVSGGHGNSDAWVVKLGADIPLGIAQGYKADNTTIYPNPAKDRITITSATTSAATTYSITDLAGRTLISGTENGNTALVSLSTLAAGIYLMHINGVAHKLVKE